ncbi:MAG: glutamine-hydrolyzing carbamoyl-phosphate synthase small subunit [Actinobacteria bacterium]|nr:glutamine-hydrolyzing carbamoyl-phosphate synthase small subunit [Actinomycetota bacterium]
MTRPDALVLLEDGLALRGEGFGARGTAFGEMVFNTSMTGYQEVLTDPSYHRQIVAMTYPHIGNYGVNDVDVESDRVQVAGLVVREVSRRASSHRATGDLDAYLASAGVVGVSEVDTRMLTRHIRSAGAMRAAISTEVLDADTLLGAVRDAPRMPGAELTTEVACRRPYEFGHREARPRVVAYDFGLKTSSLRLLAAAGCAVRVVPGGTPVEEALAARPDGVFLSNGPGDPAAVGHGVRAARALLAAGVPTFGICLGHQLLGQAVGGRTYKLPFGHHGTNQPVRNEADGTVEITSHNHGFAVDAGSVPADGEFGRVVQSHVNLNDGVNEGLSCLDAPAFSVQYHPEAGPGPHDAHYLFDRFLALMGGAGGVGRKTGGAGGVGRKTGGAG